MIELMFLITNYKDDKSLRPLYNKYQMPFNFTCYGNGTASSSLLEYFGLEDVKKYIYISLIDNFRKKEVLSDISQELELKKAGKGICFTIPLSSSTKYIKDKFEFKEKYMKKENKTSDKSYHLIVTVITEGYSDIVMNTAKSVGAGGGTLIRGRSLYQKNAKREFLGFSIEPEKDVVLIVASSERKNSIMNAITEKVGIKTKGGGIVFSIPISDAIGLYDETEKK